MKTKSLLAYGVMFSSFLSFSQVNQTINHSKPINATIQAKSTSVSTVQSGTSLNHSCKTDELNQQHYLDRGILNEFNSSYQNSTNHPIVPPSAKTPGANTISVIFHVVYNPNNPSENVSNSLIMGIFNEMQQDFNALNPDISGVRSGFGFTPASANINFCLATQTPTGVPLAEPGVVRVSTTENWYDSDNGEENKMKSTATGGSDPFNRNNYLNIWICDISNGASSGTAGYAYRPTPSYLPSSGIDGIVIDYNLGVNNEHVTSHEIGHFLGLDHTWGGSGGCSNDDGFNDTPNTAGPSFNYSGSCGANQQTCPGTQTQYENFMDYANCTCMFTQNQADYMLSILTGIRSSLLLSSGCNAVNAPPVVNFTADIADPIVIPVGGSVNFIDQSTNSPTSWTWNFGGGSGASTAQNPSATFNAVGTYDVTHTATNAYGTGTLTKIANVQVVAPTTGTACDTLRNWDTADAAANGYYFYNGAWGYSPGHGEFCGGANTCYGLQYAEKMTFTGSAQVRRISMPFFQVDDLTGTGTMVMHVYQDASGVPGTVLASETVDLADINEGFWNEFDFTTPATVTGTFWAGFELFYGSPQDTVLVGMTDTRVGGNDSYYIDVQGIGWTAGTAIGITGSIALDVMLSNGPDPIADVTLSDTLVCAGGNIIANGSNSTNTTNYYWYKTDNPITTVISTSSSSSPTFNFPTAGNFALILFADGSCKTDSYSQAITVKPVVSATVTPTATTCGNNNGQITITAPTGGNTPNYQYSLDGTNYVTTSVFSNLPSGNYTVHVKTNGDLCETSYSVTVAASSTFAATISANTSVCPGGSSTITASGGATYTWSDGVNSLGSTAAISVTPASTTQYSCLVTNGSGCQSTVYSTVNVYTAPTAPVVTPSGPTTFCAGTDVDLTSSYPTNNSWSTTETSSTITVNSTGSYTVVYTNANGCTATSAPIAITVNPAPSISAGTIVSPTTCATPTGSIQVNGSGTGTISWTGTTTGSATSVPMPYTISGLPAGSYNITYTNSNGCISNTLNQSLTDPTPPANPTISAGGPITFCNGGNVVLTSSQGSGNTWSNSSTNNAITVTTSGTYSVTYTDGNGCSASSSPVVVTVNNNPATPTITPSASTTFCAGNSINLTSSQGSGNTWSTTQTSQTINVTSSNTYTLTYTNANGCTSTPASVIVTVNPLPTVGAGTDASVCQGEIVVLNGSGATSYSWDNGVTNNVGFPAIVGATTYTVTGTDANGCSNTDDVVINGNANPTVNAGTDITSCGNGTVTLNGSGATTFTWDNGVVDGVSFTAPNGTTTYTVIGTDGNGCQGTDAVDVTINPLPTVTMAPFTNVSCINHPAFALTQGSPAGGIYTGTGVSGGSFDPGAAGVGTFQITYTYTDGNGCENTAMSSVTVDGCAGIEESNKLDLVIFPNPTTNQLTISVDGAFNYSISDMHGKLVLEGSTLNTVNLNTSSFSNGVYFVEVKTDKASKIVKVVKQ